MEVEAFPIRFTKGVRSHWRRSKYQRLEAGDGGGTRATSTKYLGGGVRRRGGSGWGLRLRRLLRRVRVVRAVVAAPARALRRVRDAYVGGMLAVARKASAMALPSSGAPEEAWAKRSPSRKQQKKQLMLLPAAAEAARPGAAQGQQPTAFEQRLIMEIYKSIVASRELTSMLHASAAHVHTS